MGGGGGGRWVGEGVWPFEMKQTMTSSYCKQRRLTDGFEFPSPPFQKWPRRRVVSVSQTQEAEL